MGKSYYVYFVDNCNNVLMGLDKKRKKVFATLDINKALEFVSINEAKKFIKVLELKSKNHPEFHIIDFINL